MISPLLSPPAGHICIILFYKPSTLQQSILLVQLVLWYTPVVMRENAVPSIPPAPVKMRSPVEIYVFKKVSKPPVQLVHLVQVFFTMVSITGIISPPLLVSVFCRCVKLLSLRSCCG
jgi:hypothetical protein